MTDTLERCARAAWNKDTSIDERDWDALCASPSEMDKIIAERWRETIRTAIEALMEPDEAIDKGMQEAIPWRTTQRERRAIFQAALKAMLGGEG